MFETLFEIISCDKTEQEILNNIENNEVIEKEIEDVASNIKDGQSIEEIYSILEQNCENENIFNKIKQLIEVEIKSYTDTVIIRNMSFESFSTIIEYLVKNTIIQTEDSELVIKETGLSKEEFKYIYRFVIFVNKHIIIGRVTEKFFHEICYDMFRLDDEKIAFLWKIFNENREELITAAMLNNILTCRDIKDSFSDLIEVFKNIVESD